MDSKKVLVTGSAGFIGFHLAKRLLEQGYKVVGLDNINDYYDRELKYARLKELGIHKANIEWKKQTLSAKFDRHTFIRLNLQDKQQILDLFEEENFDIVINLAAQAGVRYSIDNPDVYVESNILGFYNLLEACRNHPVEHLIYASSSSVYGDSSDVPFHEDANVDHPISLYAATKKSNELMAHTYSHLFNIRMTGLRFFTVYGPWGRPDMALSLFSRNILEGKAIKVFNNGNLSRDFTYIDDIITGVLKVMESHNVQTKYNLFNIGNNAPVQLLDFVKAIELATGKKAILDMQPMQPGDVHQTWAETRKLECSTGYRSMTSVEEGIRVYTDWYKSYYQIASNELD